MFKLTTLRRSVLISLYGSVALAAIACGPPPLPPPLPLPAPVGANARVWTIDEWR